MSGYPAAFAYVAIVAFGMAAARSFPPRTPRPGAGPAIALWLVVAVPSTLQLAWPSVLTGLRRSPDQIADGQLWRLATSAVVQDGGGAGTAFNLVVLASVAATAGPVLGGRLLWLVFWVGAVSTNLLVLALQPSVGAGNSMATFTVATAVVVLAAVTMRDGPALLRLVVLLTVGGLLLGAEDKHGFAVVVGALLGVAVAGRRTTAPVA